MKKTIQKEKGESYEESLSDIVNKKIVKNSMLGSLKGKIKPFTRKEREEMWRDVNREI